MKTRRLNTTSCDFVRTSLAFFSPAIVVLVALLFFSGYPPAKAQTAPPGFAPPASTNEVDIATSYTNWSTWTVNMVTAWNQLKAKYSAATNSAVNVTNSPAYTALLANYNTATNQAAIANASSVMWQNNYNNLVGASGQASNAAAASQTAQ